MALQLESHRFLLRDVLPQMRTRQVPLQSASAISKSSAWFAPPDSAAAKCSPAPWMRPYTRKILILQSTNPRGEIRRLLPDLSLRPPQTLQLFQPFYPKYLHRFPICRLPWSPFPRLPVAKFTTLPAYFHLTRIKACHFQMFW